ncbi:MAG: hypothetical protein GXP56_03745 [Deltaproteobacteria bacterium]|nr:hypothetical protein [Deltaproteobacteria bacterium]
MSYSDYSVNLKKLGVLKGEERFVKSRIKEFKQKKLILDRLEKFVDRAGKSGLIKNKWDIFYVNLKDEPLSFLKLQTILAQTGNSAYYYFKPDSLLIKTKDFNESPEKEDQAAKKKQLPGNAPFDVIISLEGHFLAKQRGPDG